MFKKVVEKEKKMMKNFSYSMRICVKGKLKKGRMN